MGGSNFEFIQLLSYLGQADRPGAGFDPADPGAANRPKGASDPQWQSDLFRITGSLYGTAAGIQSV